MQNCEHLSSFSGSFVKCRRPAARGFDQTTFSPAQEPESVTPSPHRFALPWKRRESDGRVIGFVISFPDLVR
jgi:hypothetical protein